MTTSLPEHPSITSLRYEAKQLLKQHRSGDEAAANRLASHQGASNNDSPKLHHAQHVLANEYGFVSWSKMVQHIQQSTTVFLTGAVILLKPGNSEIYLFSDKNSEPNFSALAFGSNQFEKDIEPSLEQFWRVLMPVFQKLYVSSSIEQLDLILVESNFYGDEVAVFLAEKLTTRVETIKAFGSNKVTLDSYRAAVKQALGVSS